MIREISLPNNFAIEQAWWSNWKKSRRNKDHFKLHRSMHESRSWSLYTSHCLEKDAKEVRFMLRALPHLENERSLSIIRWTVSSMSSILRVTRGESTSWRETPERTSHACDEENTMEKLAPFLLRNLHGAPIRFEFERPMEGISRPRGSAQTDSSWLASWPSLPESFH